VKYIGTACEAPKKEELTFMIILNCGFSGVFFKKLSFQSHYPILDRYMTKIYITPEALDLLGPFLDGYFESVTH
jgi:hypothetical protein